MKSLLDSGAEEANLGDGSVKKVNFVSIPLICQVQTEMTFLDY